MAVLLFENFNKAKSILKKLDKDENDKEFKNLIDIVSTKGYIGLFTKLHFIDNVSIERLQHLDLRLDKAKNYINQLKNINGKNVVDYITDDEDSGLSSIERLEDDLTLLDEKIAKKRIYNELPKSWRKALENADEDKQKDFDNLSKEIGQSTEYKNMFKKLSRIKSIDELIDEMEDLLGRIKGGLDYDSIKHKIENLGEFYNREDDDEYYEDEDEDMDDEYSPRIPYASIQYENNNIIVAYIGNYNASKILGSKSWCLSTDKSYWDSYSEDEETNFTNDIYFIWDFNKKISDDLHQIGTVKEYKRYGSTHNKSDVSMKVQDLPYFDDIKSILTNDLDNEKGESMSYVVESYLDSLDEENIYNIEGFVKYGDASNLEFAFSKDKIKETLEENDLDNLLAQAVDYNNYDTFKFLLTKPIEINRNEYEDSIHYQRLLDRCISERNFKAYNILIDAMNQEEDGWGYKWAMNTFASDAPNSFTEIDKLCKRIKDENPELALDDFNEIPSYAFLEVLLKNDLKKNILKQQKDYFIQYTLDNNKNNKRQTELFNFIIDNYPDFYFGPKTLESLTKHLTINEFRIIWDKYIKGDEKVKKACFKTMLRYPSSSTKNYEEKIKFFTEQGIKVNTEGFHNKSISLENFEELKPLIDRYTPHMFVALFNYYLNKEDKTVNLYDTYTKLIDNLDFIVKEMDDSKLERDTWDYTIKIVAHLAGYAVGNDAKAKKSKYLLNKFLETINEFPDFCSFIINDNYRIDNNKEVVQYLWKVSDRFKEVSTSAKFIESESDSYKLNVSLTFKKGDEAWNTKMLKNIVDYMVKRGTTYTHHAEYISKFITNGANPNKDDIGLNIVKMFNTPMYLNMQNLLGIDDRSAGSKGYFPIEITDDMFEHYIQKGKLEELLELVNIGGRINSDKLKELITKHNADKKIYDFVSNKGGLKDKSKVKA